MLARIAIITTCFLFVSAAAACGDGGGFKEHTVVDGFTRATDFAFTPDGRILVAEQGGAVRVVKNGEILPQPFIEVPANADIERGLLGIAVDPAFTENSYVYLYYTVENNPEAPGDPKANQLLRVTAAGDIAQPGSEVALLGSITGDATRPSCNDFPAETDCIPVEKGIHVGGGIGFAPDGKIILGIGDGTQEGLVQDLDSFAGKVVRINADGSAPEDNPFYAGPNETRSTVWAYGFRNPFKLVVRPETGSVIVGDVGTYFDEIDAVQGGANYGWPCFSGLIRDWDTEECDDLEAAGLASPPIYSHETVQGAAIIVGPFYAGGDYPNVTAGDLLFADYVRGTISSLTLDLNDAVVDGTVQVIYEHADSPVALQMGAGGDLYYLSIEQGSLQRLCYDDCDD